MPKTYELNTNYEFAFSRIAQWNGELYFVLKDPETELETMPGYEDMRWVFRVKALPFQRDWDNGDEWPTFNCFVQGFMQDVGEDTGFPLLVQDRAFVEEKCYGTADPDAPILLTATSQTILAKDGRIGTKKQFRDTRTGFVYSFPKEDFSGIEDGQQVPFYPSRNKDGKIRLISEGQHGKNKDFEWRKRNIETIFPIGLEAECEVVSNDDPKFVFLDNAKVNGTLQIPKPLSGTMPGIAEKVVLKCIGYTPTYWPLLQWTGKYAETIAVDSLPVLDLPQGGESRSVEYKSSLVYPAGGSGPDIDKQLGQVIASAAAAFMNSEGGSIFIGVRDDGTVCGIENEGQFLMKDSEDDYNYKSNRDGMQLKIVNTLKRKIGSAAATMTEVHFWQGPNSGHLVCEIKVAANEAEIPVYIDDSKLYVRNSGQNQHLTGPEEAKYIVNRIRRLDEKRQKTTSGKEPDSAVHDVIQQQIASVLTAVTPAIKTKKPAIVLGKPLIVDDNTSVPLEAHHFAALSNKEGLVRDGRIVGKAKTWPDLFIELLRELAKVDVAKFEALPDERAFFGKGARPVFMKKGSRIHLRDASDYLGPNKNIRADREDGTKEAFLINPKTKMPGLALRLIEHFGLKPEQFRIWTGKR